MSELVGCSGNGRFLFQLTPSLSYEFECATARDVWHRGRYSKCWHGGRGKIRFALFLGSFLFGSDEGRVDSVYFYTCTGTQTTTVEMRSARIIKRGFNHTKN